MIPLSSLQQWKRAAVALATMSLMLAAMDAARGDLPRKSDEPIIQQVGITPQLGARLPADLEFVDSSGRRVRLGDYFGDRPVILHLVYYDCPMLCKLSSDGLFAALSTLSLEMGEDFSIVTLSFDPRETTELSARARQMASDRCGAEVVERGWVFLTGNEPEITTVTEGVGFRYVFDDTTKQFAHAAGIFVLTPEGVVSRYLSGIDYSPRDLRLALVEASDGQVGKASDQVLLLCYMYDAATGKYGLAIMTALRAAGLATVGFMATAIVVMLRRERTAAAPAPSGVDGTQAR